jgi:hypothetical protein
MMFALAICERIKGIKGEDTCTFGRLFVNDQASSKIAVVDLDSGAKVSEFNPPDVTVKSPALYASSDSSTVFVNYRADGTIRMITSGVSWESHGDHNDVIKQNPKLLSAQVKGDMPTHFTSGHKQTIIFFDGQRSSNSSVIGFDDKQLASSLTTTFQFGPMDAQHGNAGPLANNLYFVSQPNPGYKNPSSSNDSLSVGFLIVNTEGGIKYNMNVAGEEGRSCPSYHGHAEYGEYNVFGCAKGILVLRHDTKSDSFESYLLKYHDTGRRTGTFFSQENQQIIIGAHTSTSQYALIRLQVVGGSRSYDANRDVLDFPSNARPCTSDFERASGAVFVTLLTNGTVMVYDVREKWTLRNSLVISDPFSCSGSPPTYPRLVAGYNRFFVLIGTQVKEFKVSALTLVAGRTFNLNFNPGAGIVVGVDKTLSPVPAEACTEGVDLNPNATANAKTSHASSIAQQTPSAGVTTLLLLLLLHVCK